MGLFLCLLFFLLPSFVAASCQSFESPTPQVKVAKVFDGDTLELKDGRRIRLIGINTPEIGRQGRTDETGARAARRLLQSLLEASAQRIYLRPGEEQQDRYHRHLAHLYNADGENLTERLLAAGVGLQIAIPPNLQNLDCYGQAEAEARAVGRGLWKGSDFPLDVSRLRARERGFYLLRGLVARAKRERDRIWIDLQGGVELWVHNDELPYFGDFKPELLAGRPLEVRGWLYPGKDGLRMRLRHPAAIRWLDR
ncbi:Endonuclease YncB, thermonuclease family [endosymbiont of Ridgeia piscesae]|uniref:Endonuclease YncB, thermonuclease family n=1 Tax=endosymbiont of Ridgeia piscesae TaxID=54398 RepID=A0A0T5Z7P3_9GAMM|nr:Endonuclease YncB, thermonuclease family [endosymbiont of Ridgeia piscesae]